MREILEYEIDDLLPSTDVVLRRQGIPPGTKVERKIIELAEQAVSIFSEAVEPLGVVGDLSVEQFASIFHGEGSNESETPVGEIYPRADNLALFAITLGRSVSEIISGLFKENNFALASMIDSVASEATELAGLITESDYLSNLNGNSISERQILRYSPGYCGWHISGQRALFERLEPEEIGIALTESYLMQPIKSISGVMLVGPAEIHNFVISYKFCDICKTKECRSRIKSLFQPSIN